MDGACYNLRGARMAYENCAEYSGGVREQSMGHWQGARDPHGVPNAAMITLLQHQTWLKAAMT